MRDPSHSTVAHSNPTAYPVLDQSSVHHASQWNQQYSDSGSFQTQEAYGSFGSKDPLFGSMDSRFRYYFDSLNMPQSRNSSRSHNCNFGSQCFVC